MYLRSRFRPPSRHVIVMAPRHPAGPYYSDPSLTFGRRPVPRSRGPPATPHTAHISPRTVARLTGNGNGPICTPKTDAPSTVRAPWPRGYPRLYGRYAEPVG